MVIAIVAILAAMLLPALAKAREKARSISCVNNIKQNLLSILLYTDDYNGVFLVRTATGVPATALQHCPWALRLYKNNYITTGSIYCPASKPSKYDSNTDGFLQFTYGMPRSVSAWKSYFGEDGISIPAPETRDDTCMLNLQKFTATKMIMADTFSVDTSFKKQVFEWHTGSNNNVLSARHSLRANIGWSDGHANSMTPKEVQNENTSITHYTIDNTKIAL